VTPRKRPAGTGPALDSKRSPVRKAGSGCPGPDSPWARPVPRLQRYRDDEAPLPRRPATATESATAAADQELERADDPAAALAAIRQRLDAVRNPLRTAERFGIEEIIDPRETRPLLCDWVHDAYAALPASPGRPSFGTRP